VRGARALAFSLLLEEKRRERRKKRVLLLLRTIKKRESGTGCCCCCAHKQAIDRSVNDDVRSLLFFPSLSLPLSPSSSPPETQAKMRPLAAPQRARGSSSSSTTPARRRTISTAASFKVIQQQPPSPTRNDADADADAPIATHRRSLVLGAAALSAAAFIVAPRPPAATAAGLFGTSSSSTDQKQTAPAAAGWRLQPPQGWTLAYDRTASDADAEMMKSGPKVMWANFATLGTIVVSRATRAEARWPVEGGGNATDEASVVALADALLADARDSPATYGWKVLAAASHTTPGPSPSSPVSAYDVEFVQQICRGEVLEAAKGVKRCANPRDDSDLQVVSRHFLMSFCLDPVEEDLVWVVRGSCPSENWPEAGAKIAEAVRSFSFGGGAT
jgi:hypothetical protein